jgi:predicted nucleic acid-binding protein
MIVACSSSFRQLPSSPLLGAALDIAIQYSRSVVSDSIYVALARASQSESVTADERLTNALGGRLPVKWLGAI